MEFASGREGDSPVLPDLLGQSPADQPIGTVTADGAYTRPCHAAVAERGATAIIPIRRNGRAWKEDCPQCQGGERDPARLQALRQSLLKTLDRGSPLKSAGARMRCLKAFGECITSRDLDRQTAEIHTRIVQMNRFSALGGAEIVRVA